MARNANGGDKVRHPHGLLVFPRPLRFTARYSPLKTIYGMPPALPYQPVRCRQPNCGAILNPYWYDWCDWLEV